MHRIQVLLLRDKITDEVVQDLQLAPIEPSHHNSIELVDRILAANCTLPKLEELQVKAQNEKEAHGSYEMASSCRKVSYICSMNS